MNNYSSSNISQHGQWQNRSTYHHDYHHPISWKLSLFSFFGKLKNLFLCNNIAKWNFYLQMFFLGTIILAQIYHNTADAKNRSTYHHHHISWEGWLFFFFFGKIKSVYSNRIVKLHTHTHTADTRPLWIPILVLLTWGPVFGNSRQFGFCGMFASRSFVKSPRKEEKQKQKKSKGRGGGERGPA